MLNLKFLKTSQRYLDFVKRLLSDRWQSLLVLLLGICLPLWIFQELAVAIRHNTEGLSWDTAFLLAVHQTSNPYLDRLAIVSTRLGVYWGVVPVSIAVGLLLLRLKQWRSLTYMLVALLGNAAINRIAKSVLQRIRPSLWDSLVPELGYSFPSGHAMSSMALVTVLVILTWRSRWCPWIAGFGSLFVLEIAWTRLYLGVHFPSDILAGWTVAIAWSLGVSLIIKPNSFRSVPKRDEPIHYAPSADSSDR